MTIARLWEGWAALPNGWAALILVVIGRAAAGFLGRLFRWLLDRARFDEACDRVGISDFLRKGDVSYTPSRLLATAVFWIILLISLLAAFHRLGVEVVVTLTRRIQAFLPSLIGAAGIGLFGTLAVVFCAKVVRTLARNAAFPFADLLYRVIRWVGIFVVAIMAVEQLGVDVRFIMDVVRIAVAATAFGLALAFGLGCKEMARDALRRFLDSFREDQRAGRGDLEG